MKKSTLIRRTPLMALTLVLLLMSAVTVSANVVEIVHLNNAAHGANWKAWLEARVEDFHASQDRIRVSIIDAPGNYEDQVIAMVAGGVQLDLIESTFMNAGSHAAMGMLQDLQPFLDADPDIDLRDFPPQVMDSVTWSDGTVFSMPAGIHLIIAHYLEAPFAEAGLVTPYELGDQFTWDALVEMGKRLTQDFDGDGVIDQYGIQSPGNLFHDTYAIMAQAGGGIFDRAMNPSQSRFNSPEVRTALEFIADLYHNHRVVPPVGQSYNLSQGRSTMSLSSGPGWGALLLTPTYGDDWGMSQLPAGPAGHGTTFTVTGIQMLQASRHSAEAWEWLKFLLGSYEAVTHFIDHTERMPATISAQPYFIDVVGDSTLRPHVYFDALMAPNSTHRPLLSNWASFAPLVSGPYNEMLRGNLAPGPAAQLMHEQVSAFLSEATQ